MKSAIRPRPGYLGQLPTLDVEDILGCRLELKLVSPSAKCWLRTRSGDGTPDGFVVGHAIMEMLEADERGERAMTPYGEHEITDLQRFDYGRLLWADLKRLAEKQETEPSWETRKAIDATRSEIETIEGRKLWSDVDSNEGGYGQR